MSYCTPFVVRVKNLKNKVLDFLYKYGKAETRKAILVNKSDNLIASTMAASQRIYHALLVIFLFTYCIKYATPLLTDEKGFVEKQNNGPVEFNGTSLKEDSIVYRRFLDAAANDYDTGEPNPKHDPKKGRGGRRP